MSGESASFCDYNKKATETLRWIKTQTEHFENVNTRPKRTVHIKRELKKLKEDYIEEKKIYLKNIKEIRRKSLEYGKNVINSLLNEIENALKKLQEAEEGYIHELEVELDVDFHQKLNQIEEQVQTDLSEEDIERISKDLDSIGENCSDLYENMRCILNNQKIEMNLLKNESRINMEIYTIRSLMGNNAKVITKKVETIPNGILGTVKEIEKEKSVKEDAIIKYKSEEEVDAPSHLNRICGYFQSEDSAELRSALYKLAFILVIWPGVKYILRNLNK